MYFNHHKDYWSDNLIVTIPKHRPESGLPATPKFQAQDSMSNFLWLCC